MMSMDSGSALPSEAVPARVTAIIPTYNRRELVAQAARSVLAQTFAEVQCLVVDNGSSDGTAEALRAMGDERFRVVVCEVPLGAAKARNVGIDAAHTPWVAFLDNDDLWAPTKLELQLNALAKFPSARWSATGCAYVRGDLTVRPGGRFNGRAAGASGRAVGWRRRLARHAFNRQRDPGRWLVGVGGAKSGAGGRRFPRRCARLRRLGLLGAVGPVVPHGLRGPASCGLEDVGRSRIDRRPHDDAECQHRSYQVLSGAGPFGSQYGYTWQASARDDTCLVGTECGRRSSSCYWLASARRPANSPTPAPPY